MTYALWEVHLEDLCAYTKQNIRKKLPVLPQTFGENVVRISGYADKAGMPTIRELYSRYPTKNGMWMDERPQSEYYAMIYKDQDAKRTIVPDRFKSEEDIVDELANWVDKVVLVGSFAHRCLSKTASKIFYRIRLIVPKDAIFDTNWSNYGLAMQILKRMDAKIVGTDELEEMLRYG